MPNEQIPVSAEALSEAKTLADAIVKDIELGRIPLSQAALKCSRLARLLNDFEHSKLFSYEAGGYPNGLGGVDPDAFELGRKAGRVSRTQGTDKQEKETMSTLSIESMELQIETARTQLNVAGDPNISLQSANPHQIVGLGHTGNRAERNELSNKIRTFTGLISQSKIKVYEYALEKLMALSYSELAGSAFDRVKAKVSTDIGKYVPSAVEKFLAVYDYLKSENKEDWANAAHSCRRILQDLADSVFPAKKDAEIRNGKEIKVGKDQYINRLICFVEDQSKSERFSHIVGSNLNLMGDRLDAVFRSAQKGSHAEISSREEADRYVVYTYMIVCDILSLLEEENP